MPKIVQHGDDVTSIGGWQRFLIAGIGGIAPVLISLAVVDLETLLLKVTVVATLAYAIKVIALYGIGGFVGWLNRTESNHMKLFQLGIVAPALITTALNGGRVSLPRSPDPPLAASSWSLISEASAQTPSYYGLKTFDLPKESPVQQFSRGFLGTVPNNVYFVIAGSQPTRERAEQQAAEIREQGFRADVYAPYAENPYFAVVIGAQLTLQEARELRQAARSKGLSPDTFIWTYPNN